MLIDCLPVVLAYVQHGGRTNAFTSWEHTNYFFDVNSDCFDEALDRYDTLTISNLFLAPNFCFSITLLGCLFRFAQFFIKPLMSSDATLREIKAVDSGKYEVVYVYNNNR